MYFGGGYPPVGIKTFPMNILLFGSDRFTVKCIQGIFRRKLEIFKSLDVVLPYSGGQEMRKFALENDLRTFTAPKSTLTNWTVPSQYDLALVISFGYFLPADLIKKFPLGGINIHPSLLPKYRGASPIQYTILNQDPVGGVSIINLNHKSFDSGKILSQKKLPINHPIHFDRLLNDLGDLGSNMLVETLLNFESQRANATSQDPKTVTKAPKILKSQALVDWNNDTCADVFAKYNAFGNNPALYSILRSKRIQLLDFYLMLHLARFTLM
jgi:methionyl-tRNA formyltransferase